MTLAFGLTSMQIYHPPLNHTKKTQPNSQVTIINGNTLYQLMRNFKSRDERDKKNIYIYHWLHPRLLFSWLMIKLSYVTRDKKKRDI